MQCCLRDLSRSLLHGGVPYQWVRMKLQGLSLTGNRLSGPFPMALTKINTLTNLSIEGNKFHGLIPPEIGHLTQMDKLIISTNEFTGPLPAALSLLTNLTGLRISGNNLSRRVPDFLGKLTNLKKLQIEGSLLKGPIPSGFSKLTNLYDLRISDLRGSSGSAFSDLSGMQFMKTLLPRAVSNRPTLNPNCSLAHHSRNRLPTFSSSPSSLLPHFLWLLFLLPLSLAFCFTVDSAPQASHDHAPPPRPILLPAAAPMWLWTSSRRSAPGRASAPLGARVAAVLLLALDSGTRVLSRPRWRRWVPHTGQRPEPRVPTMPSTRPPRLTMPKPVVRKAALPPKTFLLQNIDHMVFIEILAAFLSYII